MRAPGGAHSGHEIVSLRPALETELDYRDPEAGWDLEVALTPPVPLAPLEQPAVWRPISQGRPLPSFFLGTRKGGEPQKLSMVLTLSGGLRPGARGIGEGSAAQI